MTVDKPFAPACDRNRAPILGVLRGLLADRRSVLEVGSGTGQHAVHFAATLQHLRWQTSDLRANLPGICLWLADAALPNTPAPIALDVAKDWPVAQYDAVYSANTLHIMRLAEVQAFFGQVGAVVAPGGAGDRLRTLQVPGRTHQCQQCRLRCVAAGIRSGAWGARLRAGRRAGPGRRAGAAGRPGDAGPQPLSGVAEPACRRTCCTDLNRIARSGLRCPADRSSTTDPAPVLRES